MMTSTLSSPALDQFISRYTQRTQSSKNRTQHYRAVLAERRHSDGFNFTLKELIYPIVGDRASGSRMWDIDGNEYLDLAMGFGVNLFGHNPPFIKEAIAQRLDQGIHLGPQSDLAGEVATLISEMTGMERITFSNTGTEAVMTAIRLARAATGRQKIAFFSRSYHGHSDTTLMQRSPNFPDQTLPLAIGVPTSLARDVILLDYGVSRSLEILKTYGHELAAVLVEPVQDACLDIQPQEFLRELRQVTYTYEIALVFDEMLTGFRIHPGGAQAWFDVTADIATYGKILGGGLPIGVIAGTSKYLDRIDGGYWRFGDESIPSVEKTFFAGTYCKHPLTMAAARAVLNYLKVQGPALQKNLNQKTHHFVGKLNQCFEREEIPLKLTNFGSMFNTNASERSATKHTPSGEVSPEQLVFDLMRYHLIYQGVYLLGGGGFLSTAHTDADCDQIIDAVRQSIDALRDARLLP